MSVILDAEGENPVIRPIWLLWLDVEDDPLYAHTGLGSITFEEGETGDPALDGKTFEGLGVFAYMGDIEEGENGSGPVQITLPGVDPALPGFKPLIADAKLWQYRRAVLWFSYLADDGSGLIDAPEREKTGRMDGLEITHDRDTCTITLAIEGFAASSGPPLGTKYSEQPEIDADDISQQWVSDLSNRQPEIGPGTTQASTRPVPGGGGTGGPIHLPPGMDQIRRDAF